MAAAKTAHRSERAVGLGLVVGAAAVAVASRYVARRARRAADDGLVDWPRVEEIAVTRLRRTPGALPAAEMTRAESAYERHMHRVVPLLEQELGLPLPGVVERHEVVDRAEWARANVSTFRHLVDRLEPHIRAMSGQRGLAADVARAANRFVTTQQIGFLLGFLGGRVLGQYDVALLSAEAEPGRLLFVEENIRGVAAALNVPLDDFRLWIALHEATHAFEFEANAWLRPYLRDRLERQLVGVLEEARSIQSGGLAELVARVRASADNPLVGLLGPEQRQLFEETQRVMSLLEGFGDWVMDEVGAKVLPDVVGIRERFEARRNQRRGTLDRIVSRLTGLDLKIEQYRRGERFVAGVAAAGGHRAVAAIWGGPAALPSEKELSDPRAWVRRVVPEALAA